VLPDRDHTVVITSLTLAVIAVAPFLLTLGDGKDLAPPLADSDCAVRGPDPFLRIARDLPVTLHSTAPGRLRPGPEGPWTPAVRSAG